MKRENEICCVESDEEVDSESIKGFDTTKR